ncbi:MAG TPA: phosphotransferase [Mycobacteriales bacterium]|nr:phosphotransferase [Mycobacteriales bacterium]
MARGTTGHDTSGQTERVVLSAVAASFRLGGVGQVTPIAEGLMNRNWRVATERGVFVIKQVVDVDAEQAVFQHRLATGLAGRGLPVPAPLPAAGGGTLARINGRIYSCYGWADGVHRRGVDLSLAECAEVGGLLAELHAALADLAPRPGPTRPEPVIETSTVKGRIDRYLGLIEQVKDPDGFDRLARRRLVERRELLERWAWLRPDEAAGCGPTGWVHGDFHHLNLLFDAGRVAGVVDWDRVKVWPYASELARSATLLFGHGDDRGLDLGRVAAFAAGYRRRCELPAEAVAVAVHRLWWERLGDFWQLAWHYERGDRSCDHLFVSSSALLAWWTAHREQVTEAFTRPTPPTD